MATEKLGEEVTGVTSPLDNSKQLRFENEEEEPPSPGFGLQDPSLEPSGKTRKLVLGRKRNSEWVFRPSACEIQSERVGAVVQNCCLPTATEPSVLRLCADSDYLAD